VHISYICTWNALKSFAFYRRTSRLTSRAQSRVLQTGVQVASKVGNLPSKFGHARPLGSRIIVYVREGQTDRRIDGRTEATLITPLPYGRGHKNQNSRGVLKTQTIKQSGLTFWASLYTNINHSLSHRSYVVNCSVVKYHRMTPSVGREDELERTGRVQLYTTTQHHHSWHQWSVTHVNHSTADPWPMWPTQHLIYDPRDHDPWPMWPTQ